MAMPKKKMTSTRSGGRRADIARTRTAITVCPNCKKTIKPHMVCGNCGYYRGTKVK